MKKTVIFLFSVFFAFNCVFAQKTNDNGSTGGNNNQQNPPKNNTDNNNNNNSGNSILGNLTKAVFGLYQQSLISRRGGDSYVFGLNIDIDGGFLTSSGASFINAVPRLQYNYGALSADIRYDYLKGDATMQNLDALAKFNIIVKNFKLAIGQGIMFDLTNSGAFHESFLGIDAGLNNKQIIISPEFRLAYDWNAQKPVNTEIGIKGAYRILKASSVSVYLNAGAGYRYMRENGTFGNVFGGLNFMF